MKYIFRSALITGFTSNKQRVTVEDLQQALASIKYKCPNPLQQMLQSCHFFISEHLVKCPTPRKQQAITTLVRSHLQCPLTEQEIKDIFGVWDLEYDSVMAHRLQKSVASSQLSRLEWSVNNKFYSKSSQGINETTAIVNMSLINTREDKQKSVLTFEMNKQEAQRYMDTLTQVESAIDQLLLGQ